MAGTIKYRAYLSYPERIPAEKLTVKFDGVSYTTIKDGYGGYGNRSLTSNVRYPGEPFYIIYENGQNAVYTDSVGQHTIEISVDTSKVETTECFRKAVKSVGGGVMMLNLIEGDNETLSIEGATWREAHDAVQNGTMLFLRNDIHIYPCVYCADDTIVFNSISVYSVRVNALAYVWVFDGTVTIQELNYPSNT